MTPKKLLTVDDSELILRMYELVLARYRRQGASVLSARNGREALARLEQHPDTDLILLDINMPVMSGLEFLKEVKAREPLSSIPTIVISTRGKEEDTSRALEVGAEAYLTKPFEPDDLHGLIEKILD